MNMQNPEFSKWFKKCFKKIEKLYIYKHFFLWSSLYKDLWRKIPKYQEFPEFQDFWFRFSEKYFRSKFFVTSKSILLDEKVILDTVLAI